MVDSHKAQHTPGPWIAWNSMFGVPLRSWRIGSDGATPGITTPVAVLANEDKGVSGSEQVANAHLIAAAPDLLEACLAAQEGTGDWRAVVDMAIARATGSTPQRTAAAVAVALGRSPTEPGTARLAADLEGGAK